MATKSVNKTSKATKTPKATAKAKKCDCENCKCGVIHSQASFYVLIAMLVATMTVLVVSLSFNKSVRELFRPASYIYNGRFDTEVANNSKDENGFATLTAGATIDMMNSGKTGFLIVSDANSMDCDAFARRVKSIAGDTDKVFRYNIAEDQTSEDDSVKALINYESTPTFLYIKNGVIFDRLDDVKDEDDLTFFLQKYSAATEE